eukprot:Hpha_TRINITY_DN12019_c0_g3::TRINITY_DN12019_c0_g3_i1::g.141067::m.141067
MRATDGTPTEVGTPGTGSHFSPSGLSQSQPLSPTSGRAGSVTSFSNSKPKFRAAQSPPSSFNMLELMAVPAKRRGRKGSNAAKTKHTAGVLASASGVVSQRSVLHGGLRRAREHDGLAGVEAVGDQLRVLFVKNPEDEERYQDMMRQAAGSKIGADVLCDDVADAGALVEAGGPLPELESVMAARFGMTARSRNVSMGRLASAGRQRSQLPSAADSQKQPPPPAAQALRDAAASCRKLSVYRAHTRALHKTPPTGGRVPLAASLAAEGEAACTAARLVEVAKRQVKEVRKRTQEGGWTFGQQVTVDGITLFVPRQGDDHSKQLRGDQQLRPWERSVHNPGIKAEPIVSPSGATDPASPLTSMAASISASPRSMGSPSSMRTATRFLSQQMGAPGWKPRGLELSDHSQAMFSLHLALQGEYRVKAGRAPSPRTLTGTLGGSSASPVAASSHTRGTGAAGEDLGLAEIREELDAAEDQWDEERLADTLPQALEGASLKSLDPLLEAFEAGRTAVSNKERSERTTLTALCRRHGYYALLYCGGGAALATALRQQQF